MQPNESYYEQRRRWGLALIAIGVVWLVFAVGGNKPADTPIFSAERQAVDQQSFTGVNSLEIATSSDDIELIGGGSDQIEVKVVRSGYGLNNNIADQSLNSLNVTMNQNGTTVRVEVLHTEPGPSLFRRSPRARLQISVPPHVRLQVSTISGDIQLHAVTGSGTITTTSGDIAGSQVEGVLRIKATNGKIDLSRSSGDFTLETFSGDIRVEAATQTTFNATTVSGDIRFTGSLAPGRDQQLKSTAGDIELDLPANSGLRLNVTTLTGSIKQNFALRDAVVEPHRINGTVGDGTIGLTIDTTSGDVDIRSE